MKTTPLFRAGAVLAVLAGPAACHLDALFSATGSNGSVASPPPPPPQAAQLAFATGPPQATAGQALAPAVTVAVQDSAGRTLASFSGVVTVVLGSNPGGDTLGGTRTVRAVQGVATFSDLRLVRAASGYTLTASTPGLPAATSAPFAVVAGPASQLAFTVQPSNAASLAAIQPPVRVTAFDGFGNQATSFSDSVTVAIGHNGGTLAPGTLSGTTRVAAVAGVATFANLSIDQPGTGYTLTAAFVAGTPVAQSAAFSIL